MAKTTTLPGNEAEAEQRTLENSDREWRNPKSPYYDARRDPNSPTYDETYAASFSKTTYDPNARRFADDMPPEKDERVYRIEHEALWNVANRYFQHELNAEVQAIEDRERGPTPIDVEQRDREIAERDAQRRAGARPFAGA